MNQYLITKRSPITGLDHTFLIWLTDSQWQEMQPFLNGERPERRQIQAILPDHTPFEQEFLINGTTWGERQFATMLGGIGK
jgi:hypothetical protein